jgi:ribosomal protein L11 methyltransferase
LGSDPPRSGRRSGRGGGRRSGFSREGHQVAAEAAPTATGSDWLQVWTALPGEAAGVAEAALLACGALSVTLTDAADEPVFEPAPGETPLWPRLVVTGLFPGKLEPLRVLGEVQRRAPAAEWHLARLADRAWEREWLRDFTPLRFGKRLAVVFSGMTPPPGTVALRLDPGLAFGTGTHPSTALCLDWLDGLATGKAAPLAGARMVDYGCGSGILAIAALLLGASQAIAVDLDPQALLATRANAAANAVGDRLLACAPGGLAGALDGRTADVLVANILAGPLQALLPEFAGVLREGGMIALSGILCGQDAPLAAAARRWFALHRPARREDWLRLSGRRKATG